MDAFARPDHAVSPERAAEMIASGEAEVVDVRETYERHAGYVDGTRHIELERLASAAETLPRDRPVVFVCRLGARSGMATQAFRTAGYDAYNMTGGITAWVDRGLPIAPEDGFVAEH